MYLIIDCQDSQGTWKAKRLSDIRGFVEDVWGDATWIKMRMHSDYQESPDGQFEIQKVDGRTVAEIPYVDALGASMNQMFS